jgi:hypothetical protein
VILSWVPTLRYLTGLSVVDLRFYLKLLELSKAALCDLPLELNKVELIYLHLGSYFKLLELSKAGLCNLPLGPTLRYLAEQGLSLLSSF